MRMQNVGYCYEVSCQFDDEPTHDDTVHCCPDCERPNQFGELCMTCQRDREADEDYSGEGE